MVRLTLLFSVLGLVNVASAEDLLVLTWTDNNQIRRYDASGAFVGGIGNVFRPGGFDRAADGTFYVGSFGFAKLYKLDASGNKQLEVDMFPRPQKMRLGPDGNLYVGVTDQFIRRVNPSTLTVLDSLPTTGVVSDLRFGPDGLLYASASGRIDAYDIATGSRIDFDPSTPAIDPFTALFGPGDMAFGPDGDLFIINLRSILRYDLPTRTLLGEFVPAGPSSDPNPLSLEFGPDGNLYVARDDEKIVRYDGTTGAFLGTFIADFNLDRPVEMMFVPEPACILIAAGAILLMPRRRGLMN